MRKTLLAILLPAMALTAYQSAEAQLDLSRLIQGASKAVQAISLSDDQVSQYIKEYITQTDAQNTVLTGDDPYAKRLAKLTEGLTEVDGVPLNFKVYKKNEVNAFACADGSVRIYSGLMDVMTDNEVLGVIGHEMGHVAHHDTKKAFKQALLNSALRDGLAAASSKIGKLTDSQLGDLGQTLAQSKYSQKQENEADDFGYDFLKSHGKNPVAMVQSFQRLEQLEKSAGQSGQSNLMNQLFSSHPDISKRVKNMEKRCLADGYIDAQGNIVKEKDPEYIAEQKAKAEKEAKQKAAKKSSKKSSKSSKKSTKSSKKSSKKR